MFYMIYSLFSTLIIYTNLHATIVYTFKWLQTFTKMNIHPICRKTRLMHCKFLNKALSLNIMRLP